MFSVSILSAFSCNLLTVNTFQSVTTINGKMSLFVSVSFAERDGSQSLFFFFVYVWRVEEGRDMVQSYNKLQECSISAILIC